MTKEQAQDALSSRYPPETVTEYVELAEQAHGSAYWRHFDQIGLLLDDIELFIQAQAMEAPDGQ